MINEKQFRDKFNELRQWIQSTVTVFPDDSVEAKNERKKLSLTDKIYFAKTYFPHYCDDEFAKIHRQMFELTDTKFVPQIVYGFRECGKSSIISTIDALHKIIFRLRKFIEIVSASEDNATEFTVIIQSELSSNPRLIADFGDLSGERWMFNDFWTKTGTRVLALGPKMPVKGKRFKHSRPDHILVEDFEDRNSPKSPRIIKRQIDWLKKDLLKSVNSKSWSFIFIGNYFSKKSILHKLMGDPECSTWKVFGFPAIISDYKGKPQSAWEARFPLKKLLDEQRDAPSTFRVEMLQKPEDEDSTFNESWISYYDESDIASMKLPCITYVDPSHLKGEENCYKAIVVLSPDTFNQTIYVREAWIRKESKWRMVRKHFDLSTQYHSLYDGVESNGFASIKEDYDIETSTRGKSINVKMVNHRLNKLERISRRTTLFERGKIKFIKSHSDQNRLIEQLLDFPDGDLDGPDALDGGIELIEKYIFKNKKQVSAKVLYGKND